MDRAKTPRLEILSGWKEIANYLGRGVRTVQRYERELALPVRRSAGKATGSVIAIKAELDGWVSARPIRHSFVLSEQKYDNLAQLAEFRRSVVELHRLRLESVELRRELRESIALLKSNIGFALAKDAPKNDKAILKPSNPLADVLTFDKKKSKAS
jgi:hypothetical protein